MFGVLFLGWCKPRMQTLKGRQEFRKPIHIAPSGLGFGWAFTQGKPWATTCRPSGAEIPYLSSYVLLYEDGLETHPEQSGK